MNNTQFRRLVLDTPTAADRDKFAKDNATSAIHGATPSALGSRTRPSIPMTPRSIASSARTEFAKQLAERQASLAPPTKKFRSSVTPKGTRLASGYQDRTQLRTSIEEDEKASRVKALEEMVKLGQIDNTTFETLRDEIIGGSVKDVHLVKGLDRKLLERIRRGEDVLTEPAQLSSEKDGSKETPLETQDVNVDDELERLEKTELEPMKKQENVKKGEMAPPPTPLAGRKRNRDEILKELKASRHAAAEAEKLARQPSLGPRFQKVGESKAASRIVMDERGREVLITVDEQGKVKRKIKKSKIEDSGNQNGLLMPDKDVKPLGMDVTGLAAHTTTEDQDEGDIFEGVGADYDPIGLAGKDDSDSDESAASAKSATQPKSPNPKNQEKVPPHSPSEKIQDQTRIDSFSQSQIQDQQTAGPRNYFGEDEQPDSTRAGSANLSGALDDPTLLAAIKKASSLRPLSGGSQSSIDNREAANLARRERMLNGHDRDAEDMDLGFGSSRFEDEEDNGDRKMKLSVWGSTSEAGEDGHGPSKGKRKRGPKKKKGNKESAADVLDVLERRKAEKR